MRSATRPMMTPPRAKPIRPAKLISDTAPRCQPNSSSSGRKNTEMPLTITPAAMASITAETAKITQR